MAVSIPGKAILLITVLVILGLPVKKQTHSATSPATVIAAIRWMHKSGAGASLEMLVYLISPPGDIRVAPGVVVAVADVVKSLMKNQEKCKKKIQDGG